MPSNFIASRFKAHGSEICPQIFLKTIFVILESTGMTCIATSKTYHKMTVTLCIMTFLFDLKVLFVIVRVITCIVSHVNHNGYYDQLNWHIILYTLKGFVLPKFTPTRILICYIVFEQYKNKYNLCEILIQAGLLVDK